jgi:hypothetical protein
MAYLAGIIITEGVILFSCLELNTFYFLAVSQLLEALFGYRQGCTICLYR